MLQLNFYTRKGCQLCDEALLLLKVFQSTFPFTINQIDIESDERLIEKYGLSIPVIEYNGEVIQEGKIDETEFTLFLQNKLGKNGCTL